MYDVYALDEKYKLDELGFLDELFDQATAWKELPNRIDVSTNLPEVTHLVVVRLPEDPREISLTKVQFA